MLEHVQSMGLSLLNRVASEGEAFNEEGDFTPPQVRVWGCKDCGCIFGLSTYFVPGMESYSPRCARCGEVAESLGWMPYYTQGDDDEVYFIDKTGRTQGPYDTPEEAREHLWEWFEKEGTDGKAKDINQRKGVRKGCFRLVSSEGITLEDGEEGTVCQEGAEGRAQEEVVQETGCSSSCRSSDERDGGRNR